MEIKNKAGKILVTVPGETLKGAYLAGADLEDAYLRGADLAGANLYCANLYCANLEGAYLRRANLKGADLAGANLRGAKLEDALVFEHETLQEFIAAMPSLLTAGGKPLEVVAEHWDCHHWENCPIACAFDVKRLSDVPKEFRDRAALFVKLFDNGLLPKSVIHQKGGL